MRKSTPVSDVKDPVFKKIEPLTVEVANKTRFRKTEDQNYGSERAQRKPMKLLVTVEMLQRR